MSAYDSENSTLTSVSPEAVERREGQAQTASQLADHTGAGWETGAGTRRQQEAEEARAQQESANVRFRMMEDESRDEDGAANDFLWGFIWLAGGGIVTAVTYSIAAPGGTYFVFYGAMIYGGYRILKGVVKGSGG